MEGLYKLIPAPYFYLWPLLPVLGLYFWLLAFAARNIAVPKFGYSSLHA